MSNQILDDFVEYLQKKDLIVDNIKGFEIDVIHHLRKFCYRRWRKKMMMKRRFSVIVTYPLEEIYPVRYFSRPGYSNYFTSSDKVYIYNYAHLPETNKFQFTIYSENKEEINEYLHNHFTGEILITYI